VYFVDKTPDTAWNIHASSGTVSGYNASCSAQIRNSTGVFEIYTGDYAGFVWKLEQVARADDGNGYYAGIKFNHLNFDNPRVFKHYRRAYVLLQPKGAWDLQVRVYIDGTLYKTTTISQAGTGGALGSFVLGTDTLGGQTIVERSFDINGHGKRIQFEIFNSSANQDFFLSQILIDHKIQGARP
jgi:hypothetical protein